MAVLAIVVAIVDAGRRRRVGLLSTGGCRSSKGKILGCLLRRSDGNRLGVQRTDGSKR